MIDERSSEANQEIHTISATTESILSSSLNARAEECSMANPKTPTLFRLVIVGLFLIVLGLWWLIQQTLVSETNTERNQIQIQPAEWQRCRGPTNLRIRTCLSSRTKDKRSPPPRLTMQNRAPDSPYFCASERSVRSDLQTARWILIH